MKKQKKSANHLRRWCPIAKTHQDPAETECAHLDCGSGANHRLRLRRMFICEICEQGFFDNKDFAKHKC